MEEQNVFYTRDWEWFDIVPENIIVKDTDNDFKFVSFLRLVCKTNKYTLKLYPN